MVALFPGLRGVKLMRIWAGGISCTPDKGPILGPVDELEGFILSCGWGGYGFMGGPAGGDVVAEWMLTGVMINVLTWKDIKEIYEIIGGLESRVIISVFNKIGPNRIKKMKKLNEEMFSAGSKENYSKYYDLNIAFHNIHLELSDNVRIVELINKHRIILFHFAKRDYGRKWEKENYDEHLELIKLFEKGNANKAADFIRDVHLTLKPEYQALIDNQ